MKRENIDQGGLTRRRFLASSAGAAIAAGSISAFGIELNSSSTGPVKFAGGYICPPCGQACDKLTFDKAGTCPQCGMTLITADPSEGSAPTVAILLFNSAEIIDFAGPWEVFGGSGYRVFTVAEKPEPITAVYGQKVTADYTFENCPKADVLLVPGGGVGNEVNNPKLISWVQENAKRSTQVMSVCTGAFILAKAGLLDGLTATTVSGGIDGLAKAGNNIKVVYDKRYVDNGKIITTAGLSSGIDGALYLVSKMRGKVTAQQVALGIEYDWDPDAKFARASYADRYLPRFPSIEGTIVSLNGNTEHWEIRSIVTNPASAAAIIAAAQKEVISGTPHASSAVTITRETQANADRSEFDWKFKDDQGRSWRGECVAAASSDAKGKFDVTLRLVRGTR
jgi:putative intracellular protease/amidase